MPASPMPPRYSGRIDGLDQLARVLIREDDGVEPAA
jgi:hypothetical protein